MEDELKDESTEGAEEGTTEESTADDSATTNDGATEESSDDGGYQFDDDLSSIDAEAASTPAPAAPATSGGSGGGQRDGGGRFADEVFSKTIHAKFRTFYVDLKESSNGKFLKVSEKSRGRKSTIMMDAEDVPAMIEALQEVQKQL
ncbi:hypothetical protein KAR91_85350 [Candidatus Pacearchaeota archaeon]|nr:hypothetical protein [Candidatus Pacearchaeota archaeon]